VHLYTKKGKGYSFAENDIEGKYHGVGPFDKNTGKPLKKYEEDEFSYSEFMASSINDIKLDKKIVCVTPAMIVGSRLKHLKEKHPNVIFDVGIAEEHAATMCASLALNNQKPFLFMYSTFAQRAYDQILNDISRRKLPVTICIDRAGFVSGDGSTHQGIYDVAMFTSMPNMIICQGKTLEESKELIKYIATLNYPSVIRFPKANEFIEGEAKEITDMRWEIIKKSDKNVVITYGTSVIRILDIINKYNLDVELVNARFISPIDEAFIHTLKNKKVLVYEEVVENGSLASLISTYSAKNNLNINLTQMDVPQGALVPFGDLNNIRKMYRLDDDSILEEIRNICD
jgi:1-deoxy-D-xylulose-5-phosphate synthase